MTENKINNEYTLPDFGDDILKVVREISTHATFPSSKRSEILAMVEEIETNIKATKEKAQRDWKEYLKNINQSIFTNLWKKITHKNPSLK